MFWRLSLKQQFALATGFLFLGCIAMLVFIIYPSMQHLGTIRTDIRTIQGELEQEYTKTLEMRRTTQELHSVLEEIIQYKHMILDAPTQLSIITHIEELANSHDLTQTLTATFQPNDEKVDLPYYDFSIVLNGTFNNIFSYLQTIESSPYYVLIDSLNLSHSDATDAILRFDARIYVNNS